MNVAPRSVILLCVGSAALALTAPLLGWWVVLPGAVLVMAGLALLFTRETPRRHAAPITIATEQPTPAAPDLGLEREERPQPRRKHLVREAFPSAQDDYQFLLTAVVCWHGPDPTDHRAEANAVLDVRSRARALLEREAPEECESVQHHLAAALAEPGRQPGVHAVWAEEIRVELPEADAARLHQLREVRKRRAAREAERELERDERRYLGEDALADPGRALVWWLARSPGRIEDTVERIGTLSTLSAAATGAPIPELYRDLMAPRETPSRALDDEPPAPTPLDFPFEPPDDMPVPVAPDDDPEGGDPWSAAVRGAVDDMGEEARESFVDRLARLLTAHGRHTEAAQLRAEFAVADITAQPSAPPPDDDAEDTEDPPPSSADFVAGPDGSVSAAQRL